MVMAVACSASGRQGDGSPGVSQPLDLDAEPLLLTIRADPSRAVSTLVPLEGGSLTAEASDGTRFTLVVPAGALAEPTTITMTPLPSLEGIPFGEGPAMAVQLEPAGLSLYDFATLTIEPAVEIPIDQQIPIGASGPGDALEVPLAETDGEVLRLKLLHFSAAGAVKGFLADIEPWRQRLGGDVEARLSSLVARELLSYQQRGEPVPASLWEWFRKAWWDHVVKPRLDAAHESCAAGRLALETALRLERMAQLMGSAEDGHAAAEEVWALLPAVARKCIQEEYELCRDEHVVHRMLPLVVGMMRHQELAAIGEEMDAVLAEGVDLARKCLRFELAFESTGEYYQPRVGSAASTMEGRVPIELEGSLPGDGFRLGGQSALNNTNHRFQFLSCTSEAMRGGTTIKVLTLTWDTSPPDAAHPYGSIRDLLITYAPEASTETVVLWCHGAGPFPWQIRTWSLIQALLDASAEQPAIPDFGGLQALGLAGGGAPPPSPSGFTGPSASPYRLAEWDVLGGELFASTEWERSGAIPGATFSEVGSADLYHVPR